MIKGIINGILKILVMVINLFLTPINLLIENIFPSMTSAITAFTNFVNNILGTNLVYFFNLFPPTFKSILVIWFTFIVAYYTIYYTYLAVIKILAIIQKIKFW